MKLLAHRHHRVHNQPLRLVKISKDYYTVCQKNCAKLFVSELRQISTNFDIFGQKDGKEANIMRGKLISGPICIKLDFQIDICHTRVTGAKSYTSVKI